jgi:hypothetical protein
MGRRTRSRSRARSATTATARLPGKKIRMGRVQADDETWTTFRALVGPQPISKVLGDLVSEEVRRFRSKELREQALEPHEQLDALERAREQQADLDALVRRLQALHRPGSR